MLPKSSKRSPLRPCPPSYPHPTYSSPPPSSYEILIDPQSRAAYDRSGMAGLNGGPGGPAGFDAADLFAQFFEGSGMFFDFNGGPGMGRRKGKGEDSVIPYDVTLEDLYNGKTVKANLEKEAVCGVCKGCVRLPHYIVKL